jgi:predicted nucleotidyltransferase
MKSPTPAGPIALLQSHVGQEWPAINKARTKAIQIGQKLGETLKGLSSTDASIVVFGSLARREWTSKSDVDWTLLIDGQADPQHLEVAQDVAGRLRSGAFQAPGATGIFGNMTFSHDLIQKIGGREDTNENITRRVLLLQESLAFGKPDAHERVLRLILSRYLKDDRGLRFGSLPYKVPRFLLNDIVRYWRTITVDFVDKQRGQAGHGWGLRNAKLRMSRKLIFATGMLSCFSCELLCSPEARRELVKHHSTVAMEEFLRDFVKKTPLEILATFLLELNIKRSTARKLFSAYNAFLALLNDSKKRDHLKSLHYDDVSGDIAFKEVRGFSREFQEGLTALFFNDNKRLRDLTIFYGVF